MKKKFNSNRGASLVFALLIFLLCALMGASVFMMASSNAGRLSHKGEQDYYSVSSAALMVVDLLDGLTYTSSEIKYTKTQEWHVEDSGKRNYTDKFTLSLPTESDKLDLKIEEATENEVLNGELCKKIGQQCSDLVPFLNVPEEWYQKAESTSKPTKPASSPYEFWVTVNTDEETDARFGTVNGKLILSDSYDLVLSFSTASGAYAVSVYWKADIKEADTTEGPTTTFEEDKGTETTVRTRKVTVSYLKKNVTVSRGEVQAE